MACGSYCSRCGYVYDLNVGPCGICGKERDFDGKFIRCKKCKYKHKMNKKEYDRQKKEYDTIDGLIYNWIHKIGVKKWLLH